MDCIENVEKKNHWNEKNKQIYIYDPIQQIFQLFFLFIPLYHKWMLFVKHFFFHLFDIRFFKRARKSIHNFSFWCLLIQFWVERQCLCRFAYIFSLCLFSNFYKLSFFRHKILRSEYDRVLTYGLNTRFCTHCSIELKIFCVPFTVLLINGENADEKEDEN